MVLYKLVLVPWDWGKSIKCCLFGSVWRGRQVKIVGVVVAGDVMDCRFKWRGRRDGLTWEFDLF